MRYRILKLQGCLECVRGHVEVIKETGLYLIVDCSPEDIEFLQERFGIVAIPEERKPIRKHQIFQEGETITVDEIKTLVGFDKLKEQGLSDEGIVIAILGTGVNLDVLPDDIKNRVEVIDYTGEGPQDDINHGTPITYLIGSLTEKAQIKHLKVIKKDLSIEGRALLDAFEYAYWFCHIANVSWGFENNPCEHYKMYNGLMQFVAYADPPFYFVASAGNNNAEPNAIEFPAASEYAIAVGAIDKTGLLAGFSSIGPFECPELGVRIPKPDVTTYGVNLLLLDANGEEKELSGTSFAAPIVSSFIAWLYNAYARQKGLDILVGHRINPHCNCEGWTEDYGYGILQAFVNAPLGTAINYQALINAFGLGFMLVLPVVVIKGIEEALRR